MITESASTSARQTATNLRTDLRDQHCCMLEEL